jgi:RoxA-like, cytochrome c-like
VPLSAIKARWLLRILQITLLGAVSLLLVLALALPILERSWATADENLGPQDAFFHGSIGTELVPLPVLQVLPDLFPEDFGAGDSWIDRFGFLRSSDPGGLPVGFTASHRRPQSGAPSPVAFVGFSCVLCHSTRLRDPGNQAEAIVPGPGNSSLNLFAFIDAFQKAMLDEKLTVKSIADTYMLKPGRQPLSLSQRIMIGLWLRGFRKTLRDGLPKFDEPFGGALSLTPECVPTGPVRTQPFRTIVRRVLNRPGTSMSVYTKIATVYQEQLREWSQFDGSIRDLNARSALAAFAAGATEDNLAIPEITNNVKQASEYTRTLRGPAYGQVFPERPLDPEKVRRGKAVYMEAGPEAAVGTGGKQVKLSCNACHGHPENGAWIAGELQGAIIPWQQINTDPQRVTYRYYEDIPDKLVAFFPANHPFEFKREDIRPGPAGTTKGYINAPIDSVFSRAPYLHNASVLTLAELINLKPRRAVFYRGRNSYDPVDVGLSSPDHPDAVHYFRLDTSLIGNSNKGHDYPWPYNSPKWNRKQLEDLLEYLKTF